MMSTNLVPRTPWAGRAGVAVLVVAFGCGGAARDAGVGERPPAAGEEAHGDEHGHEGEGEHHEEPVVRLTPEQLQAAGITVETAGPGRIDIAVELPGEVRPNGERLAHITPRFPGIAREVRKSIGDTVRSGEVLAVIESSESLSSYDLKTLIDGTVLERHITPGEAVDRETQAFVIADLSTVWVELSVYQKDLPRVRVGSRVRLQAAHDAPEAEGDVSYLTPSVDEATRTVTARVVLPNSADTWRPGMFVVGRLLDESEAAVAVRTTALQTVEQRPVVFVEEEEGFEPRPVLLGRVGESHAEIVSGLAAGERYVAANSFLLKAELGKGSAEHAH